MKKLLMIFLYFLLATYAFAFEYNNSDLDVSNLSKAEISVLGKNNFNLSPMARIALIEQRLFGSIQSGSINDRVNFVNNVIANSNYQNQMAYSANVNNIKKMNKIRYLLHDFLNGSITGYTPSVNVPQNFYYHNTTIPHPMNRYGNRNFITQTRVIIND